MSYERLYLAWKREKSSRELQPLPPDFYKEMRDYVARLRRNLGLAEEKSLKASLLQAETRNVERLITELLEARYAKSVKAITRGDHIASGLLVEEEVDVNAGLISSRRSLERLLGSILSGREMRVEAGERPEERPKRILVRFLQNIPAIVGTDMKLYGPFKAEDVATLPVENAEIFIKRGIAQKVDVR